MWKKPKATRISASKNLKFSYDTCQWRLCFNIACDNATEFKKIVEVSAYIGERVFTADDISIIVSCQFIKNFGLPPLYVVGTNTLRCFFHINVIFKFQNKYKPRSKVRHAQLSATLNKRDTRLMNLTCLTQITHEIRLNSYAFLASTKADRLVISTRICSAIGKNRITDPFRSAQLTKSTC
jgi:hypothetical protein